MKMPPGFDAHTRAPGTSKAGAAGLLAVAALLVLTGLLALAGDAYPAGIRYFGDSTDSTYYPTSWGTHSGASWVELALSTHFPVDPQRPFLGSNSLRLSWVSAPGGDWALTAAAPGWSAYDTSPFDSLVFMAWTESAVTVNELPMIFLEDQSNARTPRQALSQFSSGVPADAWTRISVPLTVFRLNPGGADLTKINKIFFGQNAAQSSGTPHTLIVDEIRIVDADGVPPAAPQTTARAFERHIEVRWDPATEPDAEALRFEKRSGATWQAVGDARAEDGAFIDWLGASGETGVYRAVALDWSLNSSPPSDPDSAITTHLGTDQWLDMAEEAAFRYFWLHSHPASGLAREIYGSGETCTSGGTGMGIMAIIAATDRGFITREQARDRILQILQFLSAVQDTGAYHGAFSHWLNGTTGATIPFIDDDGYRGDIVETAYLIQGVLTARQYFDGVHADEVTIRSLATQMWEEVDWDWYRPASPGDVLYWHWSPIWGVSKSIPVTGWNETMITYVLAMASPTHPIPASIYHDGWARGGAMVNGSTYYGYVLPVGPAWGGPLFFAHYSHLGLDPRFHRDAYANYFEQNRNHSLI
ncbi:MAG: glucoamylase family protein, partial [Planctomycetota bacterium]